MTDAAGESDILETNVTKLAGVALLVVPPCTKGIDSLPLSGVALGNPETNVLKGVVIIFYPGVKITVPASSVSTDVPASLVKSFVPAPA